MTTTETTMTQKIDAVHAYATKRQAQTFEMPAGWPTVKAARVRDAALLKDVEAARQGDAAACERVAAVYETLPDLLVAV